MRVGEYYEEAKRNGYYSLRLIIEFLVFEKKVLQMEDNREKLTYYLQDHFQVKMNEYLKRYEVKRIEL